MSRQITLLNYGEHINEFIWLNNLYLEELKNHSENVNDLYQTILKKLNNLTVFLSINFPEDKLLNNSIKELRAGHLKTKRFIKK